MFGANPFRALIEESDMARRAKCKTVTFTRESRGGKKLRPPKTVRFCKTKRASGRRR